MVLRGKKQKPELVLFLYLMPYCSQYSDNFLSKNGDDVK
jgi:hypothetical protein